MLLMGHFNTNPDFTLTAVLISDFQWVNIVARSGPLFIITYRGLHRAAAARFFVARECVDFFSSLVFNLLVGSFLSCKGKGCHSQM